MWYCIQIHHKTVNIRNTIYIQHKGVFYNCVFVWLRSILWNSFLLLLLSRKWLNADDCCVMIIMGMFYCEIYRRSLSVVLLKCKNRFIIIFSNFIDVWAEWPLCEFDRILYYCLVLAYIFMLFSSVCIFCFLYLKKLRLISVNFPCLFFSDVETILFCLTEQKSVYV